MTPHRLLKNRLAHIQKIFLTEWSDDISQNCPEGHVLEAQHPQKRKEKKEEEKTQIEHNNEQTENSV